MAYYNHYVPGPNDSKFRTFKEKAKAKIKNAGVWVSNNKEAVLMIAPVAIAGLTKVISVTGKRCNLRREENIKNLYCYDPSLGHYWRLRRKLTNSEWLEIDRRRSMGERMADILSSLKVLK